MWGSVLGQALSLVAAAGELGGVVATAAVEPDRRTTCHLRPESRALRVVGSLAYNHEDFLGAMRALASGAVDVAPLITGTVGLEGLAAVLSDLGSGKTTHAKVLVDPER